MKEKLWDTKCATCGWIWEEWKRERQDPSHCPECGSSATGSVFGGLKRHKAKDPYDYLNGPAPDARPIKSFANDKRRGGKDTT